MRLSICCLLVTCVGLLVAQPGADFRSSQAAITDLVTAPEHIDVLVREVLEDLLQRRALPDGNLVGGSAQIAILQEMPQVGMRLGSAALPQMVGSDFYFLTRAGAQSEANRSGESLYFIITESPEVTADTATIWVGVDLVVPEEPRRIVLCCCIRHGEFQRTVGRWQFVKWLGGICS